MIRPCDTCGGSGIDPASDAQPSGMDLHGNLMYSESDCPTCVDMPQLKGRVDGAEFRPDIQPQQPAPSSCPTNGMNWPAMTPTPDGVPATPHSRWQKKQ